MAASSASSDTMDRNWRRLGEQAAVQTQTLSELTAEADACRDATDSEAEAPTRRKGPQSPLVSLRVQNNCPRWARQIAAATSHYKLPARDRPLNVVSGCTGVSAESFVLQALWAFTFTVLQKGSYVYG